jgi:hypothetical protein
MWCRLPLLATKRTGCASKRETVAVILVRELPSTGQWLDDGAGHDAHVTELLGILVAGIALAVASRLTIGGTKGLVLEVAHLGRLRKAGAEGRRCDNSFSDERGTVFVVS